LELGSPSRLVSAAPSTLGAYLGQVGTECERAHRSDQRLRARQERIDGVVVAEGDLGSRECHHVRELLDLRARSLATVTPRSAVFLARSASPMLM
jgi:hypothetical protein